MKRNAARIIRNPRIVHRSLGDGAGGVLLHLDTGAYHGVNPTGELVWTSLDEDGMTVPSLVEALRPRLIGAPDNLEDEIASYVDELLQRDLVLVADDAAGGQL